MHCLQTGHYQTASWAWLGLALGAWGPGFWLMECHPSPECTLISISCSHPRSPGWDWIEDRHLPLPGQPRSLPMPFAGQHLGELSGPPSMKTQERQLGSADSDPTTPGLN